MPGASVEGLVEPCAAVPAWIAMRVAASLQRERGSYATGDRTERPLESRQRRPCHVFPMTQWTSPKEYADDHSALYQLEKVTARHFGLRDSFRKSAVALPFLSPPFGQRLFNPNTLLRLRQSAIRKAPAYGLGGVSAGERRSSAVSPAIAAGAPRAVCGFKVRLGPLLPAPHCPSVLPRSQADRR